LKRLTVCVIPAIFIALFAPVAGAAKRAGADEPALTLGQANSYAEKGAAKLNVYLAIPRREPTHEGTFYEDTSEIRSIAPCRQRGRLKGEAFECRMDIYDTYREYTEGGQFVKEEPDRFLAKGRLYVTVGPRKLKESHPPTTVIFPLIKGFEVGVIYEP